MYMNIYIYIYEHKNEPLTLACFSVSATIGTVEFTGFAMINNIASGQTSPQTLARLWTIPAFVLNKSSRVMPGFRGTPAGITTTSHPLRHSLSSLMPVNPETDARVLQCPKSAATPGVLTTSKSFRWAISGLDLSKSERGWPIPPAAPRTATVFEGRLEVEEEKARRSRRRDIIVQDSVERGYSIMTGTANGLWRVVWPGWKSCFKA